MAQSNTAYQYQIDGMEISVFDGVGSHSTRWIADEIRADAYRVRDLAFDPGDVVIDIGAHVGLFSIYLARKWPAITIHAFEPFPANHANCMENLRLNDVGNVHLAPLAISADGRALDMAVTEENTGGASCLVGSFRAHGIAPQIASVTLDEVFATRGIRRCRLLKIDCEGMEHEILPATRCLDRIDRLSGEFHDSPSLMRAGFSSDRLLQHCHRYFDAASLAISLQTIPE